MGYFCEDFLIGGYTLRYESGAKISSTASNEESRTQPNATSYQSYTNKMVKKRNRDPEVLPEAPAHGGVDDSGSDDVRRRKRIMLRAQN